MNRTADSLLRFPCRFPVKAMGHAQGDLAALLTGIALRHAPETDPHTLTTRSSGRGRYVAATITVTAASRAQLDAIYRELTAHEEVLVAL